MAGPEAVVDVPIRVRVLGSPDRQTLDDLRDTVADTVRRRRQQADLRIEGLSGLRSRDRDGVGRALTDGVHSGLRAGPPAPGGPVAEQDEAPVDLAEVADLITRRLGAPAGATRHGVYVAVAGEPAPLLYFLDGGTVRALPLSARGSGGALRFPAGSYTLIARPGAPALLYRGGVRLADLDNPADLDLSVDFAVPPGMAAPDGPPAAPSHRFWPRVRVVRASEGETTLTVGADVRYAADVTVWRVDGAAWTPVPPIALVNAFVRYRWTLTRQDPVTHTVTEVPVPDAEGRLLHHRWAAAGDYEVRCEVWLDYDDASPDPVGARHTDTVVPLESRMALALAVLESREDGSAEPVWARSADEVLAAARARLRVAEWAHSPDTDLVDSLRDRVAALERHLVGQTQAGPFPIHAIFTERATGHTRPLALFVGPATAVAGGDHTWRLIDLTYPSAYRTHTGSGPSPAGALRAAFENGRTSFLNNYPPGEILAHVDWPGMDRLGMTPFDFGIETESTQRTAYEWAGHAAAGLGLLGLAASVVLPPTWALVPTLLVTAGAVGGAAVAGANLASRYATNSFEWDRHTAMDLLAVVGAVSTVAGAGLQVLAKGTPVAVDAASSLGRLVTFRQAVAFSGIASAGADVVLLSWDTWQQLRDIDADLAGRALFDYHAIYGQEEGERRWTKERILRYLAVLARAAANVALMVVAAKAGRRTGHAEEPSTLPPRPPAAPPPPRPAPRSVPPRPAPRRAAGTVPEPAPVRSRATTDPPPEALAVRDRLATRLHQLADTANNGNWAERKFTTLVDELGRNVSAGTNAQLNPVVWKVFTALRDPELLASVAMEVWLEAQSFRGQPDQYKRAVISLSEKAGATVIELPSRGYEDAEFFAEVVVQRTRFYDTFFADKSHGGLTHLFQDLVVDRALHGTGLATAEDFRSLLAGARGDGGKSIGHDLWQHTYDGYTGVNTPEVLGAALNEILGHFP